jgi:hypothetical protein
MVDSLVMKNQSLQNKRIYDYKNSNGFVISKKGIFKMPNRYFYSDFIKK